MHISVLFLLINQAVFLEKTTTTCILVPVGHISSDFNRIYFLFQFLKISLVEVFSCILNEHVKVFSSVDGNKLILDFANQGLLSNSSLQMN